jgi:hypothetical protein
MIYHHQEMSISHNDFYRLLPIALKNLRYEVTNGVINFSYENGNIEINPGKEQNRKIASLILPVLHVNFTFTNITPGDKEQFLVNFNQTYQRGGG